MFRSLVAFVVALGLFVVSFAAHAQRKDAIVRSIVPGEVVVSFRSGDEAVDANAIAKQWNIQAVDGNMALGSVRPLMRWRQPGNAHITNVVVLDIGNAIPTDALIAHLQAMPGVDWASASYEYTGDVKDVIPNDPQYGSQYHHPLMQNNLAWDITFGSASVIVAVTDDGVQLDHPDLAVNIWVNAGEIPGNGIDDDGNGYIDDVNGWDFANNNNNPNPNSTGDSHGTHVAGIVAARTNNATGVAGTAGHVKIMPLQFYSNGSGFNSTNVAAAFTYATNNGAKIINTSYNIDGFANDPTVTAAFNYLYDNGVLHFNSAGNNNALNPPRQVFHQSMLVANTNSTDVRSSSSNHGTGVDLAAPGTSILATVPGSSYGTKSGTSMAAPNAAAVAALVWSANPGFTRDQVAARVYATTNNIDAQNPSYVGLLGSGRVNSFQALTAVIPAPKVTAASPIPDEGSSVNFLGETIRVRFDQIMSPASVNTPGAFALTYAGADGIFGNGDDSNVPMSVATYRIASNEAVITVTDPASLQCGRYRLSMNATILQNPFGTKLDGNGDGTPGDSWTQSFIFEPCQGDVNCDTVVNVSDLLAVIGAWGNSPGGRADVNGDEVVNVSDLLAVIAAWGSCPPPPPPVLNNDDCDDPDNVIEGTFEFNTTGSTTNGPTPIGCTTNFGRDIWIRYTPSATGTVVVSTCAGATFDSYLLAYSGTCANLTQIVCNDDTCSTRAQITFAVTQNQPVLIRLGGWGSNTGTGTLTIGLQ